MLSTAPYSVTPACISPFTAGQTNAKFTKARSLTLRILITNRQQPPAVCRFMETAVSGSLLTQELWEPPLHFPQGQQPSTEAAFDSLLHCACFALFEELHLYVTQSYINYWKYTFLVTEMPILAMPSESLR